MKSSHHSNLEAQFEESSNHFSWLDRKSVFSTLSRPRDVILTKVDFSHHCNQSYRIDYLPFTSIYSSLRVFNVNLIVDTI